ncbi:ferredoxin [Ramlibacter sp. 2FC]|uniref:ferredoxin n=1 Tax=Ramlibacter sp. 2FC TaxID=2502188 RepID=UPI0010F50740
MKVRVDVPRCVAAGHCVAEAPTVFDQSDADGSVILLKQIPDPSEEGGVRRAAHLCPAFVIHLEEDHPSESAGQSQTKSF